MREVQAPVCLVFILGCGSAAHPIDRQSDADPSLADASGADGEDMVDAYRADGSRPMFLVFDSTVFSGKPNLDGYGIKYQPVVYEAELWAKPSGDASWAKPDEPQIRAVASRYAAGDLVILDIEHWSITPGTASATEIQQNIANYARVLDVFRAGRPGVRLGYYDTVPDTDYWIPVAGDAAAIAGWHQNNTRLGAIADRVDAIFPSLYTFYDDRKGWETFARANIAEAKQYGKPVYPFIWMEFHDDGDPARRGIPVPADYWRFELDTIKILGADGVVIWGGWDMKNDKQYAWNENAPWWSETKKFMASLVP